MVGKAEGGVQGVVKKWGNSAAVRIPASVLEAAQVRLDQPVDVREEGGRIVIEPLRLARYDIEALVAGITDENRHDPIEMGKPVGQEVW
jgi:antitoxin MazE